MTTNNNNNNNNSCVAEPLSLHNLSLSSNGSDTCEEKELSSSAICDDSGMQSLDESSDSTRESVSEKTEQDDLEDTVFLEALYDYDYTYNNGDRVAMVKGDVYRLLSDSCNDWWQVEKVEDGNVIYVPADYVFKLEDYYPANNRPLPPIIDKKAPDSSNITKPVESVESKPKPTVGGSGEKKKKYPAPVATPEMMAAAAKAKSQSKPNAAVLNRSFSSDNAGTVPMTSSSPFGWPDSSETSSQSSLSVNNNNNNNNNNNFDTCIQVVVNSDNQYPQEVVRGGNCSTFGKGLVGSNRSTERPKSYHYGAFSRYPDFEPDKPVNVGKPSNSTSNSDYINIDELGPILKCPVDLENGSVETLSSNSKDRKSEVLYENVQLIQTLMKNAPKMDNSVFIRKYSESWDIYEDKSNGQSFYFNKESKKTSWKAPRPEKPPPDVPSVNIVDEESSNGEKVKNGPPKIPTGWRKDVDSHGEPIFLHSSSNHKWKQSTDQTGRPYYYREGSSESVWDLPVYSESVSVNNEIPPVSMAKSMTLQHQPIPVSMPPQRSKTLPSQMPSYIESPDKVQTSVGTAFDFCKNKTGILNKTKLMENGKKVGKKWCQNYVKLYGSNIAFYKDQRAAAVGPGAKYGNAEQIVNLHGAKCSHASKDISSKKNVLLLEDVQGNQVLLQSDDLLKIQEWLATINLIIHELREEEGSQSQSSPGIQKQQQHSPESSQKSPKGTSKETKLSFPSKMKTRAQSTKRQKIKDDDKMTIREKLANLLSGRPSKESLEEKGIMKTNTFGGLLKDISEKENSPVPIFVKNCIQSIEKRGLMQDGLYRVSGNLAEIQKLRLLVDNVSANSRYNLNDECWDIHTLTGALKLFFRELKEPLIPFNKLDKLMEIAKAESVTKREESLRKYKEMIHSFPKCHFETLKILLEHLLNVISFSKHNRMLIQNVAIVFGPTLMWPERETHSLAISVTYQSQIVQFLLQNYSSIF
ncbi:rho GTPase-activating protein 12-like isoform X1 [Argonauta hians]